MKKLLKTMVVLVAAVSLVFVGGGYLVMPSEANVERHVVIAAPAHTVFTVAGNLRRFNEWSPWAAADPKAQFTYEGPETGTGQKMNWKSDDPKVGAGSQTIVKWEQDSQLETELDFGSMGKAKTYLKLVPVDGGTSVTWGFNAPLDGPLARWSVLFYDSAIGADYVAGLTKLKAVAEKIDQST
jgi:hypothetical protein